MGYKIKVNDEVVWESPGGKELVTDIHVSTPRGEAAHVRVPADEDVLTITIEERSLELAPLDLMQKLVAENPPTEALRERFGGEEPADEPTTTDDVELDLDGDEEEFPYQS